jgi:hypothetical protein
MLPLSENMRRIVAEAEAEYGESFADIVRGFAADGESRRSTAHILGTTEPTFARIRERMGIEVAWAEPTETLSWQNKRSNYRTPARMAASQRNLEIARQRSAERIASERLTTPELMARAIAIHNQGKGWRTVAKELGYPTHHTNLARQYKKHYRRAQ